MVDFMGAHKWTHCKHGHPLEAGNLVFNAEGWRECKACKYRRRNKRRRDARRASKP